MTNKLILSVFVTLLLIITPTFSLQKHKIEKDEANIVQLQDADFFNKIYIEGRNYLVLVIPDECEECKGLMSEFQKNKEKIAEEFPDGSIGYIFGQSKANMLVRKALGPLGSICPHSGKSISPKTLVVKALIKNHLFTYKGRVNVKRLSQWLKGIREDVSEKNPLIPGGVIQIDESMLHYLSKEIKDPSTVLLVPASTFIKDEKFAAQIEEVQQHYEKKGLNICVGLVEEDLSLEELGNFEMGSFDLILVQKPMEEAVFIQAKEIAKTEIFRDERKESMISWIDSISIPKITKVQTKAELNVKITEKLYLILGYTSPGNKIRFSSIANTIGELAITAKTLLMSASTNDFNVQELYFETSEFLLSTNTQIAEKFGLEGVEEAVIVIYDDSYSVLSKRTKDQEESIEIEPMIKSLKELFFGKKQKDEL